VKCSTAKQRQQQQSSLGVHDQPVELLRIREHHRFSLTRHPMFFLMSSGMYMI